MKKTRDDLYKEVFYKLGGSSIEVELEQEDYDVALDTALLTYRSNSSNSTSFGWRFLDIVPGKQHYQMESDVEEIVEIRRTRSGAILGQGYEPFTAAFVQNMMSGLAGGGADLIQFEAVAHYQELLGRMFGEFVQHSWNRSTRTLWIHRLPRQQEVYGIECTAYRKLDELLCEASSYLWLRGWAEAEMRGILAEKYSKVAQVAGPQGGIVLKGAQLLQSANEMKKELMQQVLDFQEGNEPAFPFVG